jgi:predicted XRE-type DNA-binding protein
MTTHIEPASQTFRSIWDEIADTPEQAANMRTRAEWMRAISTLVTQKELDPSRGCTTLLRGRVSRFSLDALVNVATAIGRRVRRA